MVGDRRALLGTSAVLIGLGSALISGTAVAAADTGDADSKPADTSARGSAVGEASTAAATSAGGSEARDAAVHAREEDGDTAVTQTDDINEVADADAVAEVTDADATVAEVTEDEAEVAANPAVAPARRASSGHRQNMAPAEVVGAAPDAGQREAVPVEIEAGSHTVAAVPAVAEVPAPAAPVTTVIPAAPAAKVASAAPTPAPAVTLLSTVLTGFGRQSGGDQAVAAPALAVFTSQRRSAAPAAAVGPAPVTGAPPDPNLVGEGGSALLPTLPTNGVTGVQVGHSRLAIPGAFIGNSVATDWYFPTQTDGAVDAQGVIWLQHGFGATNTFYSALAQDLAQSTNSIVLAPTLSSLPFTFSGGCLTCDVTQEAAAAAFLDPDRTALVDSAVDAGYTGDLDELKGLFVLAGHSAGGGFASATAADYIGEGSAEQDANLTGVVMFDGVSNGALDGTLALEVQALAAAGKPIYQIAAPAQPWNLFGATTNVLAGSLPGEFIGAVLNDGSHVDSMLGVNPLFDFVLQLVTKPVPAGNTAATYELSSGWINDLYFGATPQTPQFGFYAASNQQIIMGPTAAVGLPAALANQLSLGDTIIKGLVDAVGGLFGFHLPAPVNSGDNGLNPNDPVVRVGNGVTGVKTGSAVLDIPAGDYGYAAPADWYFPTQADGTVQANGVIWLQHGFLGFSSWYSDMAQALAQETNSIVVAPNIFWFDTPLCPGCYLGGAVMREAVATMFQGARAALNISASAAGLQGPLPESFLLTGHSAGGNFATGVGGLITETAEVDNLLGVVMFDGVSSPTLFTDSLTALTDAGIPDYQIAAPPQPWNAWGMTTELMTALYPDRFNGVQIDDGSHADVIGGDSFFGWLGELGSDLLVRPSPPGGKQAVRTFATGWVNDIYSGVYGPTNPGYGIYGNPNDGTYVANQPIVMGQAGATTLPAPPPVDIAQYAGTWYEQGSVKQFFSIGLVNTRAVYTPQPDGSIKVENSGNYFGPNGPESTITGSAVAVNSPTNTRLNVGFFFIEPSSEEPGNYWILDYAPDYSWAIVSDSTGSSGFILTRDQFIPEAEYETLVARAQQLGVSGRITPTAQYPA